MGQSQAAGPEIRGGCAVGRGGDVEGWGRVADGGGRRHDRGFYGFEGVLEGRGLEKKVWNLGGVL